MGSSLFTNLPTKILSLEEIRMVLHDLEIRRSSRVSYHATSAWMNLIIFRLSCCCGLRTKEIRHIRLTDMLLDGSRPVIKIRKEVTKGEAGRRKPRLVPLWWDRGTLNDITDWVVWRRATKPADNPVIRADLNERTNERTTNEYMPRDKVARRWESAIRCLGEDRVSQLSIHCGRHTFCTQSLRAGRSLGEVRDAAGHSNVSVTDAYLHAMPNDHIPDIFPENDDE